MLTQDKKTHVPLPGEQTIFTSPNRTSLAIQSFNKSASANERYSMDSSAGTAILTTQRLLYIPAASTPKFESFSVPVLNCQDTHVAAPWFGPNTWTAVVQPVVGGGIPSHVPAVEVKLTFKEGGAYDFQNTFERLKERMYNAVEMARESGHLVGNGTTGGGGLDRVHLDELPSYEDSGAGRLISSYNGTNESTPTQQPQVNSTEIRQPAPPPPRYEEVQRESIADALERSVREEDEHGHS